MNATKQIKMNFFSPDANSNKVWIGQAFADGTFKTQWGRVADKSNLASKTKKYDTQWQAEQALDGKKREKLGKGYKETAVIDGEVEIKSVQPTDIKKLATEQIIGAEDKTTFDLIEYLADVNIHNICSATSIKYNAENATFSTPLGVLTPDAVIEARNILTSIKSFNERKEIYSESRKTKVRDYFQLVPKTFGRKIPEASELLSDGHKIQKENDILDALEAAISNVQTDAQNDSQTDKLFKSRLTKVPHWTEEGKSTFRRIRDLFEKTKNVHHSDTSRLKLVRVYEVQIEDMESDFLEMTTLIGNIRSDLWHGTKASNLLSILKNGLIIPDANASHCTGRMFGNGIYTSNQSTKALNYATNFWNRSGASVQRTFMFLCDAALGKEYKPKDRHRSASYPSPGTNSTWVEPNTGGVLNHECIVYQVEQINLRYLCEFGE